MDRHPAVTRSVEWRRVARATALLIAAWTIPALLASVQIYLILSDQQGDVRWMQTFLSQVAVWYIWIPLTPVIFWLARTHPLDRRRWIRSVPVLLAASLVVVVVYGAVFTAMIVPMEGRPLTAENYFSGLAGSLVARLTNNVLLVWAVLGVAYALDYQRRWRERALHAAQLESQLTSAQLDALRLQLHPHFLFNALHTVGSLVREDRRDDAIRMLAALSDLLRYSLDRIDRQEIPLHEELEGLEGYLDIAEVRFHDRLRVERAFDPDTLDAVVPTLILQPLVENALRHGIGADPAAAWLRIASRRRGNRLVLVIEDDGPGPGDPGAASFGVGLRSTAARLEALYGGNHALRLESRNEAGSGEEQSGARLTFEIPFRVAEPDG